MNTILKIIAPALFTVIFVFLVGAQMSASAQEQDPTSTAEKAYLYAALCEDSESSYRAKACEALFTVILTDLGSGSFGYIAPRKSIDKIRRIID